jgi:hypothetical protein
MFLQFKTKAPDFLFRNPGPNLFSVPFATAKEMKDWGCQWSGNQHSPDEKWLDGTTLKIECQVAKWARQVGASS